MVPFKLSLLRKYFIELDRAFQVGEFADTGFLSHLLGQFQVFELGNRFSARDVSPFRHAGAVKLQAPGVCKASLKCALDDSRFLCKGQRFGYSLDVRAIGRPMIPRPNTVSSIVITDRTVSGIR